MDTNHNDEYFKGFSTKSIHVGQEPDEQTGSVVPPIYLSSTYHIWPEHKDHQYFYQRCNNPTRFALEKCLASLEHAKHCTIVSSGIASGSVVTLLLSPGDKIIANADMYGGFLDLFNEFTKKHQNIKVEFCDFSKMENLEKLYTKEVKMIWIEVPTNPLLKVFDVKLICEWAKKHQVLTVCDNTFLTPYFMNPLDLGVDIVVHSATKYIGGHSDIILGAILTNDDKLAQEIVDSQTSYGACAGPFECYLALRGVKTLALRMEAHQTNAMYLANVLAKHPKVEKVLYPGLETHPGHDIMKKQARGFGGMISFYLKDADAEKAKKFCYLLHLFCMGGSLGGVESLAIVPFTVMAHTYSEEKRKEIGFVPNLIRLSIGVENKEDLEKDLVDALTKI